MMEFNIYTKVIIILENVSQLFKIDILPRLTIEKYREGLNKFSHHQLQLVEVEAVLKL